MYNAVTVLGGPGMVDQTVAARAAVAIFATMAASSLFVAGPMFDRLGPRLCVLLGGWAYPLHVGSLFYYNCTLWPGLIFQYTDRHIFAATGNATFVIASGAILGVGASLVWVAQGGVVTTYVPEARRGLAIAMFLFVLNIGGSIASLWDFLSSPHSTGTVSDNAHFWFLAVMCVGWMSGIWICPPPSLVGAGHLQQEARENRNWRQMLQSASQIMSNWQVLGMIPLFFCADMFYEYQKNVVNRWTFINIRTRLLFGALYWTAQMVGGIIIAVILDFPGVNRRARARVAWLLLFVSGIIIWGGGHAFQKWSGRHLLHELKYYVDFNGDRTYVGPVFLYILYGMYDAFWKSFCYWLMGAQSNNPAVTAILVGAYKTFQSVGGAMAWCLNANKTPEPLAMHWGLCTAALIVAIPSVLAVTLTSVESNGHARAGLADVEQRAEVKEK